MGVLADIWSTDEAVYNRSPFDFHLLVPPSGIVAEGTDGSIAAPTPWRLSSATYDFAAIGVAPGQVVRLDKPIATFRPPGGFYIVDAVTSAGIDLRQPSKESGSGKPPTAGVALGSISFAVLTMLPQIEQATYRINRIFGVDDTVVTRKPSDLYDARQLEEATSYRTLATAYLGASRQVDDLFAKKARSFDQLANDAEAHLNLIWKAKQGPPTVTNKFGMRLTR